MAGNFEDFIREYGGGIISRREFIQRGAIVTGSLATATALVDSFEPRVTYAARVDPNDPGLVSSETKYESTDGASVGAYLTRPKGNGRHPAIVVIHENRGLNDHIRDIARRFAKSGYVAIAPDLLSRQGGSSSFPSRDAAIEGIRKVNEEVLTKDLTAAVNCLK